MPDPLQPFIDAITPVIADELGWVTDSLDRFIQQAILQRYSKDRPLTLVSDVEGNGTALVALPVALAPAVGTFDPLFSEITRIEYPIGMTPEEDVRSEDWQIYRSPTGYEIQLSAFVPETGEYVRFTWTAQHAADGSTVPQADFYAVADYAASLCLEAMAARASQFGDSTLNADTVNYRSKGQEYLSRRRRGRSCHLDWLDAQHHGIGRRRSPGPRQGHPMSDAVTIRITGLDQATEEVRAAVHQGVLVGLEAVGVAAVKDVVENIRTPFDGMPPAVATGNLANSPFATVTPGLMLSRLLVQAGAPADVYADPVNYGARPHMPPVSALLPWVKLKFGVDDEKEATRIAFAIAINQAKKGMRGRLMFDRAQAIVEPQAVSIIERQIAAALRAAGAGGANASS
jgi:hypothetical protein